MFQVGTSSFKLILVGLLCPAAGQEFAEGAAVGAVFRDFEEDVLQPFAGIDFGRLATADQGVNDGGTDGGVMVAAEQKVLPS